MAFSSARKSTFKILSVLALAAAGALVQTGCADSMTFSRTERTQGRILMQEGDPAGAAEIFTAQVNRNQKDFRAHYHLGEAQWALGRYPEAVQSFRTALEVRTITPAGKNDEEYRIAIINALATALAEYDTDGTILSSYENSGLNTDRALLVAETYAKSGRPDEAIAAYRTAVNVAKEDPQVMKSYGLYLESLKQDAAAEAVLRTAYRLDTTDQDVAAALLRLGVVPGPAILSRGELSTPYMPLGPLPEWRKQETFAEREAREAAERQAAMQRAAQQQMAEQYGVQEPVQPQVPQGLTPLPRPSQDPSLN